MRINREGFRIIACTSVIVVVVCAVLFMWAAAWLAWAVAGVAAMFLFFVIRFFRDPRRPHLSDPNLVYAPADGKVVAVEPVAVEEYFGGRECVQVSVFMSIWNVHANWFPVAGRITYYKYHPGKFLVAWHPKSSELNERTTTVVDTGRGEILFRQIAGFVARRIVSYAKTGAHAEQNTRAGFIKFGSRVDVMLPRDAEILVSLDDCVTGSQTPIARLK